MIFEFLCDQYKAASKQYKEKQMDEQHRIETEVDIHDEEEGEHEIDNLEAEYIEEDFPNHI